MSERQLKRLARNAARAVWWVLTPWKAKTRLEYLRLRAYSRARQRELDATAGMEAQRRNQACGVASRPLDLFDVAALSRLTGEPESSLTLSIPKPGAVVDRRTAAAFVIGLWRDRADLRARFPLLFRSPETGDLVGWLKSEMADALPAASLGFVEHVLASDYAERARQAFLADVDLRAILPHGLTPPGMPNLLRWFVRVTLPQQGLHLEELMWLCLAALQSPAEELLTAHAFTPGWQRSHPAGSTRFGRAAFAQWFGREYVVEADWLRTEAWPDRTDAATQVRTAYFASPDWAKRHPAALVSEPDALQLLTWLAESGSGLPEAVRAWVAALPAQAVACDMVAGGLNVIGHFTHPSGLRVSVESLVQAVGRAGVPVSLRDLRTDAKDDPHHVRFQGAESFDVTLIHTQPVPYFDDAYERADLAPRSPRPYRIAYWYWEFDSVPESWLKQAETVDEVWTATEFVAKGLRARLSKPVRTLFPGVKLAPYSQRPRAYFGLEKEPYTFLFTFSMTSVMERKNPLGLIRAFRLAFQPDEPVRLVLKTSFGERFPEQIQLLRSAARGHGIHVIDAVYSPDEVLSLMDCCDAYVSLHRSEGLGLTMAEAMLMAKPVIATNYSGNVDFMDEGNCLPVPFELKTLGQPIPPYDSDAVWAEPSIDEAARAMRRVFDDQPWARELGKRARISALERLSLDAAGQRVAQRLREIKAVQRGQPS